MKIRLLRASLALACLLACGIAPAAPPSSPPSATLSVSGAVVQAKTFDLAALQALPTVTATVGGVTYTGVSLWALLDKTTGIATHPGVKNEGLRLAVVATGSDGYQAALSLGEIDPAFGNQPDLVAYKADGQLLAANGFARLVLPNDVKAGRWVARLASLQVVSLSAGAPTPAQPGSMP